MFTLSAGPQAGATTSPNIRQLLFILLAVLITAGIPGSFRGLWAESSCLSAAAAPPYDILAEPSPHASPRQPVHEAGEHREQLCSKQKEQQLYRRGRTGGGGNATRANGFFVAGQRGRGEQRRCSGGEGMEGGDSERTGGTGLVDADAVEF